MMLDLCVVCGYNIAFTTIRLKTMKVRHLAKAAEVTPETVRYYTREGLIMATRDPNNGYKVYDNTALQRLQFILQARSLGFSLKDIKTILGNAQQGRSPCPMVRGLLQDKIEETEAEMQRLGEKITLLRKTFKDWQSISDGIPSKNSVCPLIESVAPLDAD